MTSPDLYQPHDFQPDPNNKGKVVILAIIFVFVMALLISAL